MFKRKRKSNKRNEVRPVSSINKKPVGNSRWVWRIVTTPPRGVLWKQSLIG